VLRYSSRASYTRAVVIPQPMHPVPDAAIMKSDSIHDVDPEKLDVSDKVEPSNNEVSHETLA